LLIRVRPKPLFFNLLTSTFLEFHRSFATFHSAVATLVSTLELLNQGLVNLHLTSEHFRILLDRLFFTQEDEGFQVKFGANGPSYEDLNNLYHSLRDEFPPATYHPVASTSSNTEAGPSSHAQRRRPPTPKLELPEDLVDEDAAARQLIEGSGEDEGEEESTPPPQDRKGKGKAREMKAPRKQRRRK
jgi:hypothetical protein